MRKVFILSLRLRAGQVLAQKNPRQAGTYVNSALFSQEPLAKLMTSPRRFFHGPGLNNWDAALEKDTRLTEGTSLEFRGEFFNAFNHAQFLIRNNGSYADYADLPDFGYVRAVNPGRIVQLGVKLLF